mmetsp:Transcript_30444/g.55071  ORF Transcript_30444/g.55071 Transcript_30444/m.55071 type:complete len:246 (-) Transcript_30444:1579-2316(-)
MVIVYPSYFSPSRFTPLHVHDSSLQASGHSPPQQPHESSPDMTIVVLPSEAGTQIVRFLSSIMGCCMQTRIPLFSSGSSPSSSHGRGWGVQVTTSSAEQTSSTVGSGGVPPPKCPPCPPCIPPCPPLIPPGPPPGKRKRSPEHSPHLSFSDMAIATPLVAGTQIVRLFVSSIGCGVQTRIPLPSSGSSAVPGRLRGVHVTNEVPEQSSLTLGSGGGPLGRMKPPGFVPLFAPERKRSSKSKMSLA